VFKNGDTFFEYREIENAYNNVFEKAQLPYTGTNIMRHGGTTWLFDESGGDASLCQLQLGVAEMDTVFTYVKRNKDALNNFSQKMWEKQNSG
jgi:integrase